jgi:hypothetical protein
MNKVLFKLFAVLVAIILPLYAYADTKNEERKLDAAYTELMITGDTSNARMKLEPLKSGYEKLFLMACIELADGNMDKARAHAKRLVDMKPDDMDGIILAGLIDRRISHPEESWMDSYLTAWKAQGSPNLIILNSILPRSCDCSDVDYISALEAAKGTPDELLLSYWTDRWDDPAKRLELTLKYSGPDMPLEIRLFALSIINYQYKNVSGDLRQNAIARRLALINQLAKELPSIMLYELYILLEDTSEKEFFDDAEITRLEDQERNYTTCIKGGSRSSACRIIFFRPPLRKSRMMFSLQINSEKKLWPQLKPQPIM